MDSSCLQEKRKTSKILFLVAEDWYFCSHRLSLAVAAGQAGNDVVVATRVTAHKSVIEHAGLRVVPLRRLNRSSLNPFRELAALGELVSIYRRERPDLVHQVALKPVIYGSIAARFANVSSMVNALGGLGFVFSSRSLLARLLKPVLVGAFRFIFNNPRNRLILQNMDDLTVVTKNAGVNQRYIRLIRSAGVDLNKYKVREQPPGTPVVMLASRMLWAKGIGEFVSAARILREQGVSARFVLVGEPDAENPSSVSRKQLQVWSDSGVVEWWGYHNDMPEVLPQARIVCLPSYYGEGIPKVLIEAMACARPIVTTDMPGCRDIIQSGKNGLLVNPRDVENLSMALKVLLLDESKCQQMGIEGRRIAEEEFALPRIIAETMAVYRELLN
jgi:glycosyltransferase involved in cell wall biosynthesis